MAYRSPAIGTAEPTLTPEVRRESQIHCDPPTRTAVGERKSAPAKKPYLRPSLECYGGLVDVTQFGGSQVVDSGIGNLGQL